MFEFYTPRKNSSKVGLEFAAGPSPLGPVSVCCFSLSSMSSAFLLLLSAGAQGRVGTSLAPGPRLSLACLARCTGLELRAGGGEEVLCVRTLMEVGQHTLAKQLPPWFHLQGEAGMQTTNSCGEW
uniref:Uncharacterized protein n=1 Tax=Knipowitschia caucasica TaxID=637954 RepID=A0AAV2LH33_KNICA